MTAHTQRPPVGFKFCVGGQEHKRFRQIFVTVRSNPPSPAHTLTTTQMCLRKNNRKLNYLVSRSLPKRLYKKIQNFILKLCHSSKNCCLSHKGPTKYLGTLKTGTIDNIVSCNRGTKCLFRLSVEFKPILNSILEIIAFLRFTWGLLSFVDNESNFNGN